MDAMTDTLPPPLAPNPAPRIARSYEVFGVTLSRETLSLVAFALCAGIVIGARIQRSAAKLHGCEECERHRLETEASIRRGAHEFDRLRNAARAGGGGEPGGSEGVSAPPPAPSPADPSFVPYERTGKPPIEPAGGDVVATEDGGIFPRIPAERDPLDFTIEESHVLGE